MAQEGVIRNFMVALGFKTDNTGLGQMQSAMEGVDWQAKALKASLLAMATGAIVAVRQTAGELDKLYYSSQRIGASVTNINAYGNAIAQLGGSAEGAIGSLESIAEKMRNSPGYESMIGGLGVATRDANGEMRDRVEMMKDLSGVLSKMPAYQANAYAESLGIDQNTLLAMRDGKFMSNMEKYQKIQKELGMNDDLAKSGNEFMAEYRDLTMMTKTGFQVLVMQAGKALIPILRLLNQLIQKGISAFSQLNPQVKDMLGMGLRFAMLALVMGGFIKTFGMIFKFIPMLKGFIGLLKLFRLAFLASPIGIILALVAALGLLYDDYKTWREGGKSLFDWSKWTEGIDFIIEKIQAFLDLLDKIKDKTVEFINKVINNPAEAFEDLVEGAKNTAKKVGDALANPQPDENGNVSKPRDLIAEGMDAGFGLVDKGLAFFGNEDAQQRVKQREKGEIGYQAQTTVVKDIATVATNTAKAVEQAVKGVVKDVSVSKVGKELKLSEQDIIDIMKVASTEVVGSLKGKNFENQAAGVVDTILNRAASGKFGNNVRAVVNQKWAFSDINAPRKGAYGSVQNVPMSKVSKKMEKFVRKYIEERANGKASSVGLNISYANPNFLEEASSSTRKWVKEIQKQAQKTGQVFGAGNAIHVHGTPSADKWKMPKQFHLTTPQSREVKNAEQEDKRNNVVAPVIRTSAPPLGNPEKAQVNNTNASLRASSVVIKQEFKTDMTLNGVKNPIDAAAAVKRQHENDLVFMARGVKSIVA